jgi:hypothetical protein
MELDDTKQYGGYKDPTAMICSESGDEATWPRVK